MTVIRVVQPCPAVPGNDPLDKFKPTAQALQAAADTWRLKDASIRLSKSKRALRKARVKPPKIHLHGNNRPFYADLDGTGVQLWWKSRW